MPDLPPLIRIYSFAVSPSSGFGGLKTEIRQTSEAEQSPSNRRKPMPSIDDVYGNYVTGAQLEGRRVVATIASAVVEQIGKDKTPKIVLRLTRREDGKPWPKGVVLNVTNSRMVATGYGKDYTLWPGRTVELWTEPTRNPDGGIGPGIKVAPAQAAQPVQALPAASHGTGAQASQQTAPAQPQPATGPVWNPAETGIPGDELDEEIPF
jgi:hypothetical protein